MPRQFRPFFVFIPAALLLLVACNREGVGGFAPSGARVAIVRDEDHLYTTNADGGDVTLITGALSFAFGTTFSPDGSLILYVDEDEQGICRAPAGGSGPAECASVPLEAENGGILTYLPDGSVLLGYEAEDSRFRMLLLNANWEATHDVAGIDHFFISQNAYKEKRGEDGTEWYLRPDGGGQPIRWVITRDEQAFAFSAAAGGVTGPVPLPVPLSAAVQGALAGRDAGDLSSGAVSPDGGTVVFRTREPGGRYSLYMVNLQQANGDLVGLVNRARFRVAYTFSPDGSQVAYESEQGGRSVWIAPVDGSEGWELAGSAALTTWH